MKDGNGKRKQWSSAEKLRIVLAGLQADTKKVFVNCCHLFCGVGGRQCRWSMIWIIAI